MSIGDHVKLSDGREGRLLRLGRYRYRGYVEGNGMRCDVSGEWFDGAEVETYGVEVVVRLSAIVTQ